MVVLGGQRRGAPVAIGFSGGRFNKMSRDRLSAPPRWVRLVRTGDTVDWIRVEPTESSWTVVGRRPRFPWRRASSSGLAVTSHSTTASTTGAVRIDTRSTTGHDGERQRDETSVRDCRRRRGRRAGPPAGDRHGVPGIEASVVVDASEDRARQRRRVNSACGDATRPTTTTSSGRSAPRSSASRISCTRSVTADLLNAGIPVLVEKPMAGLTMEECDSDGRRRPQKSGSVLAVGLLRRCSPSLQWVKRCARRGNARAHSSRSSCSQGRFIPWPVASPSMFRVEGGGVLADAGFARPRSRPLVVR